MNKNLLFFCFWIANYAVLPIQAQFYTITDDTMHAQIDDGAESSMTPRQDKEGIGHNEDEGGFFAVTEGHDIEIGIEKDIPIFDSARDSMMAELLEDRLSVCLPLDFLMINSNYGYRTDPIFRCTRFHDGIDLRCSYTRVYSMMPGTVRKVRFGNRGYGNYVVMEHGELECLYGHLSRIFVKEGDSISAGMVVAISGNTGKATGPHLHIRMRKGGKSVNPKSFIDYLNEYITRLRYKICRLRLDSVNDKIECTK